jgi:hypothetical protein
VAARPFEEYVECSRWIEADERFINVLGRTGTDEKCRWFSRRNDSFSDKSQSEETEIMPIVGSKDK